VTGDAPAIITSIEEKTTVAAIAAAGHKTVAVAEVAGLGSSRMMLAPRPGRGPAMSSPSSITESSPRT
jgi:hypothetical protein